LRARIKEFDMDEFDLWIGARKTPGKSWEWVDKTHWGLTWWDHEFSDQSKRDLCVKIKRGG